MEPISPTIFSPAILKFAQHSICSHKSAILNANVKDVSLSVSQRTKPSTTLTLIQDCIHAKKNKTKKVAKDGKLRDKQDGPTPTPRASLTCLLSKSPRPFGCRFIMRRSVAQILLSNAANKWIMRIGVSQQRTDGEQHVGDRQSRTPILLQNVKAYLTVVINIAVVNACSEHHLWRLERVVAREVDVKKEYSPMVR